MKRKSELWRSHLPEGYPWKTRHFTPHEMQQKIIYCSFRKIRLHLLENSELSGLQKIPVVGRNISNIINAKTHLHDLRNWHFTSPVYAHMKWEKQESAVHPGICFCSVKPDFACDIPTAFRTPPTLLSQELPRCSLDYIAVFNILFALLPSLNVKRQYLAGCEAENNGCFAEQSNFCYEPKRSKRFYCHRMRREGQASYWFL